MHSIDIKDDEAIEKLVGEIPEKFGRLDVVVNNLGFGASLDTIPTISEEDIDAMFRGAKVLSQEAINFFKDINPPDCGGRLLQVSSILCGRGTLDTNEKHYTESKFG